MINHSFSEHVICASNPQWVLGCFCKEVSLSPFNSCSDYSPHLSGEFGKASDKPFSPGDIHSLVQLTEADKGLCSRSALKLRNENKGKELSAKRAHTNFVLNQTSCWTTHLFQQDYSCSSYSEKIAVGSSERVTEKYFSLHTFPQLHAVASSTHSVFSNHALGRRISSQ
jgi:hypothetical protein